MFSAYFHINAFLIKNEYKMFNFLKNIGIIFRKHLNLLLKTKDDKKYGYLFNQTKQNTV